jgi:hypothetical protein
MRACALWSDSDPFTGFLTRAIQLKAFSSKLNSAMANENLIEEIHELVGKYKSAKWDEEDIQREGLLLLTCLDNLYWTLFFKDTTLVPPPHVYFTSFSSANKDSNSNEFEIYLSSRMHEASLILPKSSLVCFKIEGATPGPYEGTMRGSDPCLPRDSLARYVDSVRDNAARYYAFAVPNQAAVNAI